MSASRAYAAFLFDMDGTLIDSIPSAIRVWTRWAARHGVHTPSLMAAMHGVRAVETIRRFAPAGVDPEAEAAILTQEEIDDVDGTVGIVGVHAFLAAIPADRWAIVTSAPRLLAERRLAHAGITPPPIMVTAEDVAHGKPAPDCFLLAAERLGVAAADCLVWEDSAAGIAAGEAAGADVAVITATHQHEMATAHPAVHDYAGLTVTVDGDGRVRWSSE